MSREHGTRACYVFGPEDSRGRGRGCRCTPCRAANREDANQRTRLIAYGQWEPYVDSSRARGHLGTLMNAGIGLKRAAALAGVGTGTLSKIVYGGPGDRPPTRRIRPQTEAAILAVRPSMDLLADSAATGSAGTVRRIQALVARGWSQARIAGMLGMGAANLGDLLYRREAVTAARARAVRSLYARLWDQPPPESSHREKIAASRARRYAAERRWPPPMAWDDIDNPRARPAAGWRRETGISRQERAA